MQKKHKALLETQANLSRLQEEHEKLHAELQVCSQEVQLLLTSTIPTLEEQFEAATERFQQASAALTRANVHLRQWDEQLEYLETRILDLQSHQQARTLTLKQSRDEWDKANAEIQACEGQKTAILKTAGWLRNLEGYSDYKTQTFFCSSGCVLRELGTGQWVFTKAAIVNARERREQLKAACQERKRNLNVNVMETIDKYSKQVQFLTF